ncbi:MAG: hydrogenase iron-sulfur subunit [Desulfobacterales bacterium]|nr:hydrogenase iron-sulfur subunit [Desulfobacterales bacterium]
MSAYQPKIVCFSCNFGWGYLSNKSELMQKIQNWIPITCTAKIDPLFIFQAFAKGADGVLILACPETQCHYEDGEFRTEKMVLLLQNVIEAFGIQRERVQIMFARDPEGHDISNLVERMRNKINALGPLPKDIKGKGEYTYGQKA